MRGTAIVAGGSIGGLLVGGMLRRRGWHVRVFEKVPGGIESRGAGIATHPQLMEALHEAGADGPSDLGIRVVGRTAFGRDGREICHFPYEQVLCSWGMLYHRLRTAFPASQYELDKEIVSVEDGPDCAVFHFRDGTSAAADLAIGADGIWSRVRDVLAPLSVPRYSGYVAWRGLVDEEALSSGFAEKYARVHAFYVARNEQFILYAVNGEDGSVLKGRRRFGFLWYRAADHETMLPDLLTDCEGIRGRHSIAPPRIQPRHIEQLREDAEKLLPPQFADVVHRSPRPFLQPIYDLMSRRIAFQRTALIGDAAFVARPHVGAGVLKAACDASELLAGLEQSDSIKAAFTHFEARRIPAGEEIVKRGRYLGAYLEGVRSNGEQAPVLDAAEVIQNSARG